MQDIEQEIIKRFVYHESNPKRKLTGTNPQFASWLDSIHKHFEQIVHPRLQKSGEKFIEYWPIKLMWGKKSQVEQGIITRDKFYRVSYGTFGTGYLCLTNHNLYLFSFAQLTEKFPLYEKQGFFDKVLLGLANKEDKKRPSNEDKNWSVPHQSILGAQITDDEYGQSVINLVTTAMVWEIHDHFTDTLPIMLTGINMCLSGKLAQTGVQQQPDTNNSQSSEEVLDLLNKLGELKSSGIITDIEFEQKKQQLLKRL